MKIEKKARPTLTALEMDIDDELHFTLADGQTRRIVVKESFASITETTCEKVGVEQRGAVTNYRFRVRLEIDGHTVWIGREVATPRSFYQPRELMGMRIWLDACDDIFEFLTEDHGTCRPRKRVRLAVQDASLEICPVLMHPWCPLPAGGLRIEDCYNGEDCWLGAYYGAAAHGGLDINHPAGTALWTPIPIDTHEMFDSLAAGDNNNRWRGVRTWPDGSTWTLQAHHVIRLLVEEGQAMPAGTHYAEGAGVHIGAHEHSHFKFRVLEPGAAEGDEIWLDPWILFWQMYRDRVRTMAD